MTKHLVSAMLLPLILEIHVGGIYIYEENDIHCK